MDHMKRRRENNAHTKRIEREHDYVRFVLVACLSWRYSYDALAQLNKRSLMRYDKKAMLHRRWHCEMVSLYLTLIFRNAAENAEPCLYCGFRDNPTILGRFFAYPIRPSPDTIASVNPHTRSPSPICIHHTQ